MSKQGFEPSHRSRYFKGLGSLSSACRVDTAPNSVSPLEVHLLKKINFGRLYSVDLS